MLNFSDEMTGNCISTEPKKLMEVPEINQYKYCQQICNNYIDCKAIAYSNIAKKCKLYGGDITYDGDGNENGYKCYENNNYVKYSDLNKKKIKNTKKITDKIENSVLIQSNKLIKLKTEQNKLENELKEKSKIVKNNDDDIALKNKNVNNNKKEIITNERMLELTKENINYKQKIIYSLLALIIISFVIMIIGYIAIKK